MLRRRSTHRLGHGREARGATSVNQAPLTVTGRVQGCGTRRESRPKAWKEAKGWRALHERSTIGGRPGICHALCCCASQWALRREIDAAPVTLFLTQGMMDLVLRARHRLLLARMWFAEGTQGNSQNVTGQSVQNLQRRVTSPLGQGRGEERVESQIVGRSQCAQSRPPHMRTA